MSEIIIISFFIVMWFQLFIYNTKFQTCIRIMDGTLTDTIDGALTDTINGAQTCTVDKVLTGTVDGPLTSTIVWLY